jgi:hypothetical protein
MRYAGLYIDAGSHRLPIDLTVAIISSQLGSLTKVVVNTGTTGLRSDDVGLLVHCRRLQTLVLDLRNGVGWDDASRAALDAVARMPALVDFKLLVRPSPVISPQFPSYITLQRLQAISGT